MLVNEGAHERALRIDTPALTAHVVERVGDQRAGNALPAEVWVDDGVREHDVIAVRVVLGVPGDLAVDEGLVTAVLRVVRDGYRNAHGWLPPLAHGRTYLLPGKLT